MIRTIRTPSARNVLTVPAGSESIRVESWMIDTWLRDASAAPGATATTAAAITAASVAILTSPERISADGVMALAHRHLDRAAVDGVRARPDQQRRRPAGS